MKRYGSLKIPCVADISATLEQLKDRKPQALQQLALQPGAQSMPGRAA